MHIHRFCLLSVFVSAIALQAQASDKMPPLIDPQQDNIALADMNDPNAAMTLQRALALAVANNPQLMAYSWETRAQDGKILQAGLLPNPELELAAEQVGGTGGYQGFNSAQTTVQITQTIQLGNKRLKNKQLAVLDKSLAVWDYEAKRLDIWMEVIKTYVENLAIQQRLEFFRNRFTRAENPRAHSADRTVHDLRDFLVAQAIDLAQDDGRSLIEWQLPQCVLQAAGKFFLRQQPVRRRLASGRTLTTRRFVLIERDLIGAVAAAPKTLAVAGLIDRDAVHPGAKARLTAEMVDRAENPEEDVLGQIQRLVAIAKKVHRELDDHPLVLGHKFGVRAFVTARAALRQGGIPAANFQPFKGTRLLGR